MVASFVVKIVATALPSASSVSIFGIFFKKKSFRTYNAVFRQKNGFESPVFWKTTLNFTYEG